MLIFATRTGDPDHNKVSAAGWVRDETRRGIAEIKRADVKGSEGVELLELDYQPDDPDMPPDSRA